MTIKELLDTANFTYPDRALANYYDEEGKEKEGTGDTLALFIVRELIETFDPDSSDSSQNTRACQIMTKAEQDLSIIAMTFLMANATTTDFMGMKNAKTNRQKGVM